nr:MAG TPA: Cytosine specific methyltransferase [Caudoviricetes sp.]
MSELAYATICSGIECMSAAVAPLGGWRPVFFSEIEPFPCSLLKYRYPTVPNLGDMTRIKAERIGDDKWRITNGAAEIELAGRLGCLAGGTPCQDVSVAGKRAGMAEGSGTRSSLAFHFARLCRELQPRWVVWENVPGVLTSNGGRDFAHFVRSIGECGYSLAYRTLDAQWVRVDGLERAVPQRRRRVWLVGRLGDDWRAPAEVLFEPEGVRGDTPPRRIAGQGAADGAGGSSEGADRRIVTNSNDGQVVFDDHSQDCRVTECRDGVGPTISRKAGTGGGNLPIVVSPHGFDPHAVYVSFDAQMGCMNTSPKEECGETLAACHRVGVAIGLDRASYNQGNNAKFGFSVEEECAPTVVSKGPGAVSFEPGIAKREGASHRFSDEVTSTLRSDMGDNLPAVAVDYIVRRLTPLECERLQGLPDGYTRIPYRGKSADECPDSPRYKALGNGWAVNCARWICQRIQKYVRSQAEWAAEARQ